MQKKFSFSQLIYHGDNPNKVTQILGFKLGAPRHPAQLANPQIQSLSLYDMLSRGQSPLWVALSFAKSFLKSGTLTSHISKVNIWLLLIPFAYHGQRKLQRNFVMKSNGSSYFLFPAIINDANASKSRWNPG
jgi:hypothetical protein